MDRFPSTSTARTTTSEIEVIAVGEDATFKAVVTFHSQWETTTSVSECVANACLATLYELPDEKIADRLLHHRDQVFRLNYVLGSFADVDNTDDEWAYEGESGSDQVDEQAAEPAVSAEQQAKLKAVLDGFLSRIHTLAGIAKE